MTNKEDWPEERGLADEKAAFTRPLDATKPLVDLAVLDQLSKELDDNHEGYTRIFVANFIDCLPHRVERLRLALTTGDWEAAVDAAMSLKTSSQMVGAERLAALVLDLETEVRGEAARFQAAVALPRLAAAFLRPIKGCGYQTASSLKSKCSPQVGVA